MNGIKHSYHRTVGPTFEPVTIDEAREQARGVEGVDDALLAGYIVAARVAMERELGAAILTQTWVLRLDLFPCWEIPLPVPPLASVASIKYQDVNDVEQTVAPADYVVDAHAQPVGRVVPAYGHVWPSTYPMPNAVTITYVAGVGTRGEVDEEVRQAILAGVASRYENREADSDKALLRLPAWSDVVANLRCRWAPEYH